MNSITVKLAQSAGLVYGVDTEAKFDEATYLEPINDDHLADLGYRRVPRTYVVENATVLGTSNIILNAEGFASVENIVFNPTAPDKIYDSQDKAMNWGGDTLSFQPRSTISLDKAIFIGGHRNFGHWVLNHLARLCFIGEHAEGTVYLVPNFLNDNQKELLRISGVNPEDIVFIEPGMAVQVAHLTIPQMPWHQTLNGTVWFSRGALHGLRRKMGVKDHPDQPADQKVFLTRKNTFWRRLINEDEVFEKFENLGFRRLDIGDLSIEEQIALGQRTRFLMAPMGANSIFLLNMPAGSSAIEFSPPTDSMNVLWRFADILDIHFEQVVGTPKHKSTTGTQIDQDYTVDMADVEDAFARLPIL